MGWKGFGFKSQIVNLVFIEAPDIYSLPNYYPVFIKNQRYTGTEGISKDIVFKEMDKIINKKC